MPIYQKQDATLGEFEGTGFAFVEKPREDDRQRGIFIGTDNNGDIKALSTGDELSFTGIVHYPKSSRKESFNVQVKNVTPIARGHRVDFRAVVEED